MKYSLYCYLFCLFMAVFVFSNPVNSQINSSTGFDQRLEKWLDQKEYFKLETQFHLLKNNLDDKQQLYFQSFLDNAFNRIDESIAATDNILQYYSGNLSDSMKAALVLLQADSYFKQFQYAKAASKDSILLSRYIHSLDSDQVSDIKNDLLMRNALKNIPPQQTIINNGAAIHWKKNRMGLIEIPVQCHAAEYGCVFDTRANMSCITETYAAKLKLKILDVSYTVGSGLTGIKFKSTLGVADSINIGGILIRNAVFLVMPDAKLRFFPFAIHVIIGFPVIEQLKEIQLYKNGRMIIPAEPSRSDLHNLIIDGFDPVTPLKTGNDTLCFQIDLGATGTTLYSTYFERYKDSIVATGKNRNIKLGGAGGARKKDIYSIPLLDLSMQSKTITLQKVNVFTQKTNPRERFYGNLGQNFTSQFDELIFNFKYMYLKVQ